MKFKLKPEELQRIAKLDNIKNDSIYSLLGYQVNLKTGELHDSFSESGAPDYEIRALEILLMHYSTSETAEKASKLIKYADLPGGYAYEKAFELRAVKPVADAFGEKPVSLIRAAKLLGGNALELGDAAVEIPAFYNVPLVYILWAKNEFPASVTILYDESASHYLPTEDLAVLAELTTNRLLKARSRIIADK